MDGFLGDDMESLLQILNWILNRIYLKYQIRNEDSLLPGELESGKELVVLSV